MVKIVANDIKIEKEIQNLLDILIDAGSGFHSNLLIHEEDGGLSVKTIEPMQNGKELLRLPRTVLMPGDQYTLDIVNDNFIVEYPNKSIATDLQKRVIDKMYEIYNLTNKIKLHDQFSFLLSLKDTPKLIDKLAEARNFSTESHKDWIDWIKCGMSDEQHKRILCETYVKTRPLGYSDPVRESSVSMIMPVLDFMNHHWEGGTFSVGQGHIRKGDLTMQCSQPFEDSTECFANYGIMDAFDTLVRYDFVDKTSPVLRSVSLDIEGPAGDTIKIDNKVGFVFKAELDKEMKDLRRFIPDISFEDDQMIVSHILLPLERSKFALARTLNIILAKYNDHHSRTMTPEEEKIWKIGVQEAIIEKNKAYYKSVLDLIDTFSQDQKDSFGVARIKDLAQYQLERIDLYEIKT